MNDLRHFKISEFDCPCCGQTFMETAFLNMIDNARHGCDPYGIKFNISSGYRCSKHNLKVKGSRTSSHLLGLAADIECIDSTSRFWMERFLMHVGFKRMGEGTNFVHVDLDLMKAQNVKWRYDPKEVWK